MNRRRFGSICAAASLAVLAGCGSPPGEATDESSSAVSILLPVPSPVWQAGFTPTGVVAGLDIDRAPLYPCRAVLSINGLWTPGKTRADWNWCAVSYGGRAYMETTYETLVPQWIAAQGGVVPAGAFPAGSQNGQPLYTCRANFGGSLAIGKTGAGIAGCSVPFESLELVVTRYEVLATPSPSFGLQPMPVGEVLPFNALQAGADSSGAALYPCIVSYEGTVYPGQTKGQYCEIAVNGRAQAAGGVFTILTASIGPTKGTAAFLAGADTGGGALGVCTASYGASVQVGKYIEALGLCDFPFGTAEIAATSFDVVEARGE